MKKLRMLFLAAGCMIFLFTSNVESSDTDHEILRDLAPVVIQSENHDVSLPLRYIKPIHAAPAAVREIPMRKLPKAEESQYAPVIESDGALQLWQGYVNMPATSQNFEGINNIYGVAPPDTNGDVGPDHYIQIVNLGFQIWNKTGISLYGPADTNTIWTGFGGRCETDNDGDPIVLYDHLADRWLISQFSVSSEPYYQCIAISQTPDPTGSWYRYAFLAHSTKMNDYPKFGLWPDGYYMSVNQFDAGGWAGAGVFAFDRSNMLIGAGATMQYFDLYPVNQCFGGLLPSDLDGAAPPAGAPNYFSSFDDGSWNCGSINDNLKIWDFHVDWTTPANSTFGLSGNPNLTLTTAAFDPNMCGYNRNCIPQQGTTQKVDAISDRLMYRLQYRNFGAYQAMVTNHTVDADTTDHAGVRWYELRKTGGDWSIYQQGTYAPDSHNRWMGSIAMDVQGNIALGYSVSSSSLYPSIRYAGRLVGDPAGTLPQTEATIVAGTGYQNSVNRWGDYSSMSVDPTNGCTFWYTQEYFSTIVGWGDWKTRIASFKFPECTRLQIMSLVTWYYNSILNRAPEPGGAEGWTTEIERIDALGIDIKEGFIALGKLFLNSDEYLNMAATDDEYIIDLYETFLGRTPTQEEIDGWAAELAGGLTRNLLMNYFIFSVEFKQYMDGLFGDTSVRPEYNLVNDLYRGLLSRLPDDGGFNFWLAQMQDAQCNGDAQAIRDLTLQIALLFLNSQEYADRNTSNSEYIEDLYNGILRRGAELAGYLFWLDQLNNGTYTRETLLTEFVNSAEFQTRVQQVIDAGCAY